MAATTNRESNRRLVVVSYHFPPVASAGVHRLLDFIAHLDGRGWRVTVIAPPPPSGEPTDGSLDARVPARVRVVRTAAWDPVTFLDRGASATGDRPARRAGIARRIFRRACLLLAYPDRGIGWTIPLAWRLWRETNRDTTVLSSTPPHSTHMVVRFVRALRGFRWVADFRDPWTAPTRVRKGPLNLAVQRAMERWVLTGADCVVANTPGNRSALLAAFTTLDAGRVSVITNGFDPDRAVDADAIDIDGDMAYFGELYPGMLDPYLAGVRRLVGAAEKAPVLDVFGHMTPADRETVEAAGLSGHIRYHGTLGYDASIATMRRARSLLLLLMHRESWATCVPSKLYPYLFAGPPIFAIVPEGDAARIVRETKRGTVVTETDPERVARALSEFVGGLGDRAATTAPAGERLAAYSIPVLSARLEAELLAGDRP